MDINSSNSVNFDNLFDDSSAEVSTQISSISSQLSVLTSSSALLGTVSTYSALPTVTTVSVGGRYFISDLNIFAIASGDHWEYTEISPKTWANIYAISTSSLAVGMQCKASDFYYHGFIWDGTYWQSANQSLIKVGSSRTNVTISGATSTTYQAAYTISIPAHLLGSGGKLHADVKATFSSASTSQKRIALMDSSLSTTLMAYDDVSANVNGFNGRLTAMFDSQTAMTRFAGSSGAYGSPFIATNGGAAAFNSNSADWTAAIVGECVNTAESITFIGFDLYIERRTA